MHVCAGKESARLTSAVTNDASGHEGLRALHCDFSSSRITAFITTLVTTPWDSNPRVSAKYAYVRHEKNAILLLIIELSKSLFLTGEYLSSIYSPPARKQRLPELYVVLSLIRHPYRKHSQPWPTSPHKITTRGDAAKKRLRANPSICTDVLSNRNIPHNAPHGVKYLHGGSTYYNTSYRMYNLNRCRAKTARYKTLKRNATILVPTKASQGGVPHISTTVKGGGYPLYLLREGVGEGGGYPLFPLLQGGGGYPLFPIR